MSGFVYLWYDKKHKRFYIGSHWGAINDGYICSSWWMKRAYKLRPADFKRRILKIISSSRLDLLIEEQRWLSMIKDHELKTRYYNLIKRADHLWHADPEKRKSIGEKISATNTGRKLGPCSPEKAAKISTAKKASFERRKQETGQCYDNETMKHMQGKHRKGTNHTEEWKRANTVRLKQQWADGIRQGTGKPWLALGISRTKWYADKKRLPRAKGERLKQLWADPEWAARQREKLSQNHRSKKG